MQQLVDGEYKAIIKDGIISIETVKTSDTYWVAEVSYGGVMFGYIFALEGRPRLSWAINPDKLSVSEWRRAFINGEMSGLCGAFGYLGDMVIDKTDNRPDTLDLYLNYISGNNLKVSLAVKTETNLSFPDFTKKLLADLQ